jgi:predicted secreted protein
MLKTRFCTAIAIALLTPGCVPAEQQWVALTQEHNGKSGSYSKGTNLALRLPSNGTTGYSWEIDRLPSVLRLVNQDYQVPASKSGMAGEGGFQTLVFQSAAPGEGSLRIVYRQPWDKAAPPAETFTFQVRVED